MARPVARGEGRGQLKGQFGYYTSGTGFSDDSVLKNPPANSGDTGLIPGSRRSPGGGNGNPLIYLTMLGVSRGMQTLSCGI